MSSLEKQLEFIRTGGMYNDLTLELVSAREQAVLLTNEYNSSFASPPADREGVLRRLLGSMGSRVHFEPTFRWGRGASLAREVW